MGNSNTFIYYVLGTVLCALDDLPYLIFTKTYKVGVIIPLTNIVPLKKTES